MSLDKNCASLLAASVGLFALALAGYGRVSNFAGSWYEWESDPSNPVQVG